jgi:nicotinate-nucleotide pyrophosphorylase (carboxylating)
MTGFTPAETAACCHLIDLAFREDFGSHQPHRGDITTLVVIPPVYFGRAHFVARSAGIVAGLPAVDLVLGAINVDLRVERRVEDGARVEAGTVLATAIGLESSILNGERTALNFLQHLSGIATLTRSYVDAVAGLPAQIFDTRKTIPGWRLLEKYAVRCGGGHNHRMGLYDQFLIKDNHLAARAAKASLTLGAAVKMARRFPLDLVGDNKPAVPVEIEVDNLEQFDQVLPARPDIILLDNMTAEQMREAVRRRNSTEPGVLLEASGGVNLQTVRAIAESGVDRISVGALTHSAPALDIGLDYQPSA